MIASGELTERISIYRPQRTAENVIPHSNFLQLLRTCWAKVRQVRASDFIRNGLEIQDQTYQVTIRWVSGISTTDVILYKGLYFSIKEMTEVRGSHLSFTVQLHNSLNLGKKVVSGGNGSDVPPPAGDDRITEPMIDKLFEED